jgi:hypothetical protein
VQSILEAVALVGMVSAGLLFVVYAGNMNDMSIPMTMAMSGMMTVQCINLGFVPALIIGVGTGAVIGLINGFMIGKLRANPSSGLGLQPAPRRGARGVAGKAALRGRHRKRHGLRPARGGIVLRHRRTYINNTFRSWPS